MSAFNNKVIKVINKSNGVVMLVDEYDEFKRECISEEVEVSTDNCERLRELVNEIKWWCGEEEYKVEMFYMGENFKSCSEFVYKIYFDLRRLSINKKVSYGY